MKIKLSSIFVDNQDKALEFYTEVLGFIKRNGMPAGRFKWLTAVSPDGSDDVELVPQPNANPVAKTFQGAIFRQGISTTA
jgi:catechol 2,3-dioxygenase-like lactoylglutathione lyase family enzyme